MINPETVQLGKEIFRKHQYLYRHTDGVLFVCVVNGIKAGRLRRDEWLKEHLADWRKNWDVVHGDDQKNFVISMQTLKENLFPLLLELMNGNERRYLTYIENLLEPYKTSRPLISDAVTQADIYEVAEGLGIAKSYFDEFDLFQIGEFLRDAIDKAGLLEQVIVKWQEEG